MPADESTLKAELDPVAGTHKPEDYVEAVRILAGVKLLQSWSHQSDPWLRVINHDKIQKDGIRRRSATPAVPIPYRLPDKSRSSPGVVPDENSNEVEVEVEREGEGEAPKQEPRSTQDFLDRYENKDLIEKALTAIASTRKSNKISDSVRHKILAKWEGHPVEIVMDACKTYLEKNCASKGLRENYLLGIINNREREIASVPVNTVEIDPDIVEVLTRLRLAHAEAGGYGVHGPLRLDTNTARIAKVLAERGREYCEVVQIGHIRTPDKDGKYLGWIHAYPATENDKAEPDWDWIEQHHKTGEAQKAGSSSGWTPGSTPPGEETRVECPDCGALKPLTMCGTDCEQCGTMIGPEARQGTAAWFRADVADARKALEGDEG